MKRLSEQYLLIIAVITLAILLRFSGLNWDQGTHLHPDERFLTMVVTDLKIPVTLRDYLDPTRSSLNPVNIVDSFGVKKYSFFVYGTLPLVVTKIASVITNNDTYNGITIVGRLLSGFCDLLVIILIYKTIQLFEKYLNWDKTIKLWGSFFYAVAVLPIQLSHFFAVDSFLNTFLFGAFYFATKYYFGKKASALILSSVFLGLAVASKITAILYLPLLFVIIIAGLFQKILYDIRSKRFDQSKIYLICLSVLVFIIISYVSLRIANPYMFESSSFLNPQISNNLTQSLKTLQSWSSPDVWYPPGVQWISKTPFIFALYNLTIFGLGIPIFIFSILGMVIILRKKNLIVIISMLWLICLFMYQSTQFVKSIRYFIIIYPLLSIYAAYGFVHLHKLIPKYMKIISIILILIWPAAFMSIYLTPHSRITASEWIYKYVPEGSKIAWELWDDPLPLRIYGSNKTYNLLELNVFDYDTPEKITTFNNTLSSADYYILSSNRAWGSIPTVPDKYPFMTKFYNDLLKEKTNFRKVAEFTSYPSLRYIGLPIQFSDDSSEEAFTVYDHPKVMIFKKIR